MVRKEQIVGIAIRLFAIFLVIYTLRHASSFLPYLVDSQSIKVDLSFVLLVTVVPILVAAFLWLLPLTIARNIIPGMGAKEPSSTLSNSEIAAVAFPILGLWVLTTAIPDTFYWATFTYMVKNAGLGKPELSPENVGNIVATIVELLIGFWLLLGSRGIASMLNRLRYARS